MKRQFLFAVMMATSSLAADPDWRPKPEDLVDVSDPRFDAIRAYRDAEVAMRVHAYIGDRCKAPGDEADVLVTDYKESFGAMHILKPLDFLVQYPDSTVVTKLLEFQVEQTAGVWPPWKYLAIRIFRDHPEEFDKFLETLDADQKAKLSEDVRIGFSMATEPFSKLAYRIPAEDRQEIEQRIKKLEQ